MMKTHTVTTYTIDELPEDIQEKAYSENPITEYFWLDEGIDTARAYLALFGAELIDYSLGTHTHSYMKSNIDHGMVRGIKVKDIPAPDDCPLTGYCMDYAALKGFFDHAEKTGDILGAVKAGLDSLCDAIVRDLEDQGSFEYWKDYVECNGWEFTETGELF